MKLAILGASGFVGSSLAKYFSHHKVIEVNRSNLDLLDSRQVSRFLIQHDFDVIINAATTMTDDQLLFDTRNNLGLFMNFYNNRQHFGKFINLSSGAEFDRRSNIDQYSEEKIFDVLPADSYGFGQNMKSRICYDTPGFYTIRIFNCFGLNEIQSRIFPRYLNRGNTKLEINNDRYFDYFSIQDLATVVEYFIINNPAVKDINAVYLEKFRISQVLARFCELQELDKEFIITSQSQNNYTGNGKRLAGLPIRLSGLDYGLEHYNEGIK